jgi:hypothetical protein
MSLNNVETKTEKESHENKGAEGRLHVLGDRPLSGTETLRPVDVAQAQLDAYNAQDLGTHCGCFTDDVVVSDLNGDVILRGIEAYHAKYRQVFADFPKNRAELVGRISLGETVIDHERVFRDGVTEAFQVIAIYTVAGGKIARVDFRK